MVAYVKKVLQEALSSDAQTAAICKHVPCSPMAFSMGFCHELGDVQIIFGIFLVDINYIDIIEILILAGDCHKFLVNDM